MPLSNSNQSPPSPRRVVATCHTSTWGAVSWEKRNPIESEEEYRWIAAYSPYDNVETKAYPPIIALSGLTDPRVTYWEPTKWIARLRATAPDAGPFLLKTNMAAGHGGKSGRFQRLEEIAFEYAYAIKVAGKM